MTNLVEVVNEEEEDVAKDSIADLCNRKSGVQCPNNRQGRADLLLQRQIVFDDTSLPLCGDRIFSYVVDKSINCRCGLTWVSGGSLCLKYGVGYPFLLADVRVVNERLADFHSITLPQKGADIEGLTEAVAEELGQTAEESNIDELTIQSGEALEAEEPSVLPDEPS